MRAASDVGGTFTDLVYYTVDDTTGECGQVETAKADTTTPNFEQGVMNTLAKSGLSPAELTFFAHGSTVIINALTERKGAKTALITTQHHVACSIERTPHDAAWLMASAV